MPIGLLIVAYATYLDHELATYIYRRGNRGFLKEALCAFIDKDFVGSYVRDRTNFLHVSEEIGTFSVAYRPLYDQEAQWAVDWNWQYAQQWARSTRLPEGSWAAVHGLNERAWLAILEHFGLLYWADEFPPERIFHKSPAWLARQRRRKEYIHGLTFLVIANTAPHLSDYYAEEYE